MTESRRVRRIQEGLVIVVSILVAFGLDAWWDSSVEHRDFRDDLANVQQELESNIETVRLGVSIQTQAMASIDVLLAQAAEVPVGSMIPTSDTIVLAAIVNTSSYDPSTGAVDALIASGRLSDLDDPELKSILTDFRTAVLDIREDEFNARSAAHEKILPLFWESAAISSAFAKVNDFYSEDFGKVPLASEEVELPHVPGLLNRLRFRRAWLLSAVRELEIHQGRLERASELIRDQLGG